ncbi:MAG: glycosyltransferase [Planctomycetes bacterium]|nr:glycosyltransferase [Planctomycetota bacterium]
MEASAEDLRITPVQEPTPFIVMLVAHDPTLDPRIDWEATSAAGKFEVLVLGVASKNSVGPAAERVHDYDVRRMPRPERMSFSTALQAWKTVFQSLGHRPLLRLALMPPALLLLLLFTASGNFVYSFQSLKRLLKRGNRDSDAVSGLAEEAAPGHWGRFVIFCWTLRHVLTSTSALCQALEALPRRPRVVHCNDLDALLAGVWASSRLDARLVLDSHEYWPHSNVIAPGYHVRFFALLEGLLVHHADAVVTVSTPLARRLEEDYRLAEVEVVPNAEPWRERCRPAARGEMTALARGRVKFLFQGHFMPERGLEEVLECWSRAEGGRAALFLRGPDSPWKQELLALAGRLDLLGKSVYFLAPVPESLLVEAAQEADVGLIPYSPKPLGYRFACPNKLSQYLHAGLAILTNALPYVQEVVEDGRCGYVYDSVRPGSLPAALEEILADEVRLQQCRTNALEFARTRFNWQVQGRRLMDLYESR